MAKPFRKLDPLKVRKLKSQGLTNTQIAQRLGVTQGAIYHVLRKLELREIQPDEPLPPPPPLTPDLL